MNRRGIQLVEVLLAVALAGGPLIAGLELVRSSTRRAAIAEETATVRLLLTDLSTVFSGESIESLRQIAATGPRLPEILGARLGRVPAASQAQYRQQVSGVVPRVACRIDEKVEGIDGLVRLTLSASASDGRRIEVFRLLRPPPQEQLTTEGELE